MVTWSLDDEIICERLEKVVSLDKVYHWGLSLRSQKTHHIPRVVFLLTVSDVKLLVECYSWEEDFKKIGKVDLGRGRSWPVVKLLHE